MLSWKVSKYMHLVIGKWCKFCHIIWNLTFWVTCRNHLYLILVWKAGKFYIRTIHGYSWFKIRAVDVNCKHCHKMYLTFTNDVCDEVYISRTIPRLEFNIRPGIIGRLLLSKSELKFNNSEFNLTKLPKCD